MSLLDSIDSAGDRSRELVQRMTPRDRGLAALMGGVLFLLLAFFALSAMSSAKAKARLAISDTAKAQAQVNVLLSDFSELNEEIGQLEARLAAGATFSPATWLETTGNELGISANIKGINEKGVGETDYYRAQRLDLIIDALDLAKTVEFIHRIENAEPAIRIDELRVKADLKNRQELDLLMTISVLKPLETAG